MGEIKKLRQLKRFECRKTVGRIEGGDGPNKARYQPLSYKSSGVDIDAGDDLVQRIKPLSRGTHREGVIGGLGGFGGLFRLKELSYKHPILCEAVNGVGTKIRLALDNEMYESIGYDLLAMCANDVLESGAEPVVFLDYIACGKLQVPVAAQIVKGISEGCRDAGCALLGGETAEMPTVYEVGKYDIAGYCLGVLEEGTELPRYDQYLDGDLVIGITSSGLHCGGFEVIYEKLVKAGVKWSDSSEFGDPSRTIGQQLSEPIRIYVKDLVPLFQTRTVKAVAHITSGLEKGLSMLTTSGFSVDVDLGRLHIPEVFGWLAAKLGLCSSSLLRNVNCGLGLVFVVSKNSLHWQKLRNVIPIGQIKTTSGPGTVKISNFNIALEKLVTKYGGKSGSEELPGTTCHESDHYKQRKLLREVRHRPESFVVGNRKRLTRIPKTFKDPILIIGTDGVGTKIKIAQDTGLNSTVGIDLVAMCVNDILCNGAEPYTFSSYYAGGALERSFANDVMEGIVSGSEQANCSLIDVVTAEVPLLYKPKVYDLAGFSLGIAENSNILPRSNEIHEGDSIIGIPSSGVHSNGFSLVHAVMKVTGVNFSDQCPFSQKTFGEELLTPTEIYVNAIAPILQKGVIKALAHITGGGLIENIPRVLTKELGVRINAKSFVIPPIFAWIASKGNVSSYEMQRTYNCGLGMIIVVDSKDEKYVLNELGFSHRASKVGTVIKRKSTNTPQVVVENFDDQLLSAQRRLSMPRKRVAVLISGSGTNLQALIDAGRNSAMDLFSEIVLVISNKENAYGLERASIAGIPSIVIPHNKYTNREEFDLEISNNLESKNVDIVCLAGFMRVLTEKFVRKWKGKIINIHPALLPKHPGLHGQKKAIDAGDTESGCTVHFVDEGVDTGGIILQERVPILPNDTVETLTQRIQKAEHYTFPQALRLVATGTVQMGSDGKVLYN